MLEETLPVRGVGGRLVRARGLLVAAACALIVPSIAQAQIRKSGPEFLANTYILYDQEEPRIEALGSDSFIVVWLGPDPESGGIAGVRARIFDRGLAHAGDEFLITTAAEFDHRIEQVPSISASGTNGFVVAWESYDSGDLTDIGAQTFAGDASPGSPAVHVNQSVHAQQRPSVAAGSSGDFVVVWRDKPTLDDYAPRTRVRKFNWTGAPVTDELGVSLNGGWSHQSSVIVQPSGKFVVVWQEDGAGIVGQQFSELGEPLALPFVVSTSGENPEIAMTDTGAYIVVWQAYGQDENGYDIFGRRFAADTTPIADEVQVNSYVADQQVLPSVATNASGEFVVLWVSYKDLFSLEGGQDGSGRGVFGQYFGSDGARLGREFQVNAFNKGNQGASGYRGSDVAMWPDGGFVAVWESEGESPDGFGRGVFGQAFVVNNSLGVLCGDTNSDLLVTVRDALHILRSSVGFSDCENCLCDVDSSDSLTTTDALLTLRIAVGLSESISCPRCVD